MHFQLIELIDERIYPKWEMGKTAPNNFSDFFTTFAHAAFCNTSIKCSKSFRTA